MKVLREVELYKAESDSLIKAQLVRDLTVDVIDEMEGLWSPYMVQQIASGRPKPEHSHWVWSKIARDVEPSPNHKFFGVIVDNEIQAVMLIEDELAKARLAEQLGHPLVYVDLLATAPWNDRALTDHPIHLGAGLHLLKASVEHSISLGYKGRMGLHSLPQSENFYLNKCRMADCGADPHYDNLRYFEFTKKAGAAFIK